jgi:N-acetylglutamate synthase-like GNAT family acetyltransferase
MEIRRLSSSDIAAAIALRQVSMEHSIDPACRFDICNGWSPDAHLPHGISEIQARVRKHMEAGIVATLGNGEVVGIASILPSFNTLHAIYVHPSKCEDEFLEEVFTAIELLAIEFEIDELYVDALPSAEKSFADRGYSCVRRDESHHLYRSGASVRMSKVLHSA